MTEQASSLLSCRGMTAGYNGLAVVSDIDLTVRAGEVVALVGANGAGKTTTLRALAGLRRPQGGEVACLGSTRFEPLHRRARRGLALVADDRSVLATLTVHENLRLGLGPTEEALSYFPELRPLLRRRAALLSGGEQQMLSLARALAASPLLLLADELSLGLAPQVTARLHRALREAADRGAGVLVVEQKVRLALATADRIYVLKHGRVVREGTSADLAQNMQSIEEEYLGSSGPAPEAVR
ncbi:ABC transporter ATP-binding protein [Pseudonocardia xishanensis]|uniref:ABC transporter ATP-binding protein n=1 Tax=Pseudonocardia xishanensis TaxID=630995 RepID=A0ABP8RZM3_9PSEU